MPATVKQLSKYVYECDFTAGVKASITNPFNLIPQMAYITKIGAANATNNAVYDLAESTIATLIIEASTGVYRVQFIPGHPGDVVAVTGA